MGVAGSLVQHRGLALLLILIVGVTVTGLNAQQLARALSTSENAIRAVTHSSEAEADGRGERRNSGIHHDTVPSPPRAALVGRGRHRAEGARSLPQGVPLNLIRFPLTLQTTTMTCSCSPAD